MKHPTLLKSSRYNHLHDSATLKTLTDLVAPFNNLVTLLNSDEPNLEVNNHTALHSLLEGIGNNISRPYTVQIGEKNGHANLHLATIALLHGNLTFFETILNSYPEAICADHFPISSSSKKIAPTTVSSPLKAAIFSRNPDLVRAVVTNQYFTNHSYKQSNEHRKHTDDCIKQARTWYSREESYQTDEQK